MPMTTTTHLPNPVLDLSHRGKVIYVGVIGASVEVWTAVPIVMTDQWRRHISTIRCANHEEAQAVASLWRAVFYDRTGEE